MKENYLKQTDFAKLVKQAPSRINLLIKNKKLEVVILAGVTFVLNNASNRSKASKKK